MKQVDAIENHFNVSLNLPGSKSITLRDTVLATLGPWPSLLEFPADCDDFSRISEALIQLGATISPGRIRLRLNCGYRRRVPSGPMSS